MPVVAIISVIINFALIIILFLTNREIKYIMRQLTELKNTDTNALLHTNYGLVSPNLLNEINSLLVKNRADQAYYTRKKHELEQMITNISHDLRTPLTSATRKSIIHNFANIRSIKQAIKHDFRNSTFGTRVFFMFFNQVNRQFS